MSDRIRLMARTPDGISNRDKKISVRVTTSTLAALDRQRGSTSRSEYLRRLIVRDGAVRRES